MSANIVHFLPSLFTIKLAMKGPKVAPNGTKEIIHAASSSVICTFSPGMVIFGIVGEVQVSTHPAAKAARFAEK